MINSEYIKSMNCNFERIKLEEAPEEKRYQYCIVSRGGISGLLPCSLRMLNGDAYLYYDITSKQGLGQIFRKKTIGRQWIKDFVWNMKRISKELNRFLLDEMNVIWYPDQIFQDLEDNKWSFLYYPYYKGENGFRELLEFIIEKIDYKDEALVECVYKIYEQYDNYGNDYLVEKIFQDMSIITDAPTIDEAARCQECIKENNKAYNGVEIEDNTINAIDNRDEKINYGSFNMEKRDFLVDATGAREDIDSVRNIDLEEEKGLDFWGNRTRKTKDKRSLLSFLDGSRKKDKDIREKQKKRNHYLLDSGDEYCKKNSVAEDEEFYQYTAKDKEVGRTVYIEKVAEEIDQHRRIYDEDGKMLCLLEESSVVIGKKRDEADMIIDDSSVSRVHARIFYADGEYILEDLNSTNGTFKNGLRLKPYEKRKLMCGDEIRLGSVALKYS